MSASLAGLLWPLRCGPAAPLLGCVGIIDSDDVIGGCVGMVLRHSSDSRPGRRANHRRSARWHAAGEGAIDQFSKNMIGGLG
ncbi:hypothetical protein [Mycolicibacterium sp. CBMA 226]|uniref:hypothetical protein n=1 Tax=Mycolicibacterium sp. CBMA 226 TaxID=2606611 RepID=UPI0012DFA83B|nr:hypothetical protein [Mycolicibacterium sp. CBMA 226]MUL78487.1 hypothetical protein [Mycolicibacterium sp. CBMA 226]